MGMKLYTADDIFYPVEHGLNIGDELELILVGGGNAASTSMNPTGALRGGDTYFGSQLCAHGGKGARGGVGQQETSGSYNRWYTGGGGGGGYVPGAIKQGGHGNAAPYIYVPNNDLAGNTTVVPIDNNGGGCVGYGYYSSDQYRRCVHIIAGTGAHFGGGNGSLTVALSYGYGGDGYGAGGGCNIPANPTYAGNAGEIVYASHKITQEDCINGIPITIGHGGVSGPQLRGILKRMTYSAETGGFVDLPWRVVSSDECLTISSLVPCGSTIDGMLLLVNTGSVAASYCFWPKDGLVGSLSSCIYQYSSRYGRYGGLYYANGYYVTFQETNGDDCTVYWTKKESAQRAAREGIEITSSDFTYGTDYGTWTMSHTVQGNYYFPMGVTGNGTLIRQTASTTFYIYPNWTPSSSTAGTVKNTTSSLYVADYTVESRHNQSVMLVPLDFGSKVTPVYLGNNNNNLYYTNNTLDISTMTITSVSRLAYIYNYFAGIDRCYALFPEYYYSSNQRGVYHVGSWSYSGFNWSFAAGTNMPMCLPIYDSSSAVINELTNYVSNGGYYNDNSDRGALQTGLLLCKDGSFIIMYRAPSAFPISNRNYILPFNQSIYNMQEYNTKGIAGAYGGEFAWTPVTFPQSGYGCGASGCCHVFW